MVTEEQLTKHRKHIISVVKENRENISKCKYLKKESVRELYGYISRIMSDSKFFMNGAKDIATEKDLIDSLREMNGALEDYSVHISDPRKNASEENLRIAFKGDKEKCLWAIDEYMGHLIGT